MSPRPGKGERHRRIIAELKANPTLRISALAEEFSASAETVRRDIDKLSRRGSRQGAQERGGRPAAGGGLKVHTTLLGLAPRNCYISPGKAMTRDHR